MTPFGSSQDQKPRRPAPKRPAEPGPRLSWKIQILYTLGLAVVAWPVVSMKTQGPPHLYMWPVAWFISVVIHELGHGACALASGFRILAFGMWPIAVERTRRFWRLTGWSAHNPKIAGFVASLPRDARRVGPKLLFIVAGGPSASLLLGTAAILWPRLHPEWAEWMVAQAQTIAAMAFVHLFVALLPVSTPVYTSDGAKLRQLWRGGPQANRYASALLLVGAVAAGKRCRDWDPELIRQCIEPDDGSEESLFGHQMRYNWLIDNGRVEEAGSELDDLLPRLSNNPFRASWEAEASWFEARFRNNAEAARRWLEQAGDAARERTANPGYAKARAALALLEGSFYEAEDWTRQAKAAAGKLPMQGIALAIEDALNLLQRDIEKAHATSR